MYLNGIEMAIFQGVKSEIMIGYCRMTRMTFKKTIHGYYYFRIIAFESFLNVVRVVPHYGR